MAWAYRTGTFAQSGSLTYAAGGSTLAMGAAVSTGDRIVVHVLVVVNGSAPATPVVTDNLNAGNYQQDVVQSYTESTYQEKAYTFSKANSASGTPTVKVQSDGSTGGFAILAYSGLLTTDPGTDQVNSATGTGGTATSAATPATTAANELVTGAYVDGGWGITTDATKVGSGWNYRGSHGGDLNNFECLVEDIDSGSSGATPAAVCASGYPGGSVGWAMLTVVYKLAATYITRTASSVTASLALSTQHAAPVSPDIAAGNWSDQDNGTTNLWAAVDEATASDTDYIKSGSNPSSDICTLTLATLTTPDTGTRTLHYRYGKDAGTEQINLQVELLEGTTQVQSWTHTDIPTGWTQADQTVTGAISNYANLRVRLTATQV